MESQELRRLKELEEENRRLKHMEVSMNRYTKEEHIGAVGVHVPTHVADKSSRPFQNPKSSTKQLEEKPNANQLKHYRELDEKRQL